MKRKVSKTILLIFVILLACMSMSKSYSETIRGAVVATLGPLWNFLSETKYDVQHYKNEETYTSGHQNVNVQKLQIENQQLINEIIRLQELVLQERHLSLQSPQQLNIQLQAVPARVIFRTPSSWNSSLWLNVGKADNIHLEHEIIAKNSPVVVGSSIIGVIDYVGEHQCRVKLITDSSLTPSVRAVRGGAYKQMLADNIALLLNQLTLHKDVSASKSEQQDVMKTLTTLLKQLKASSNKRTLHLAKGELHGTSKPLWRSQESLLHGIGFNYDFADDEGPARDLRSGLPLEGNQENAKPLPLLKVNDLLVTTGMDGIFPAGLHVAEVTHIHLLKEGDYYYELEAKPTAGNLQDLSIVFIIPPLGYDSMDQAAMIR